MYRGTAQGWSLAPVDVTAGNDNGGGGSIWDGYDPYGGLWSGFGALQGQISSSSGGSYGGTPSTSPTQPKPKPAPKPEPPPTWLHKIGQCTLAHYGLDDLALRGASWLGAAPIDKAARSLPIIEGASQYTNAISYFGLKNFPGLKIGEQILGTNRVFGLLGRANLALAAGLVAYDVTSIALCTAGQ